jgi:hypothetical protein
MRFDRAARPARGRRGLSHAARAAARAAPPPAKRNTTRCTIDRAANGRSDDVAERPGDAIGIFPSARGQGEHRAACNPPRARVPVVLARRAGSVPSCLASFAAAALVAYRRRETAPVI